MDVTGPRGFIYALEPERRRRQWQLDASMARLSELRRRLGELESTRETLHQECASQAAQVGQMWAHCVDPATHALLLRYVVTLQQYRAEADGEIAKLTRLIRQAREECSFQQQKLEVLDRHRADALKAYATESHRKAADQADQDWTARASHRSQRTEAA